MFAAIVSFLAPITASTMLIPQIFSAWKIRNDATKLAGISIPTQLFMLLNSVLWLVMGLQMGTMSVWFASVIGIPTIVFTLAIVFRARIKNVNHKVEVDTTAPVEDTVKA